MKKQLLTSIAAAALLISGSAYAQQANGIGNDGNSIDPGNDGNSNNGDDGSITGGDNDGLDLDLDLDADLDNVGNDNSSDDNDGIDVDADLDNVGNDNSQDDNDGVDIDDNDGVDIDGDITATNTSSSVETNTTVETTLTIGDVQLNATSLSGSVSGVGFGAANPLSLGSSGSVTTGDINNSALSDNRGMIITNQNTGVGEFQSSQSINVGTVNN